MTLAVFFGGGAMVAGTSVFALLFPGSMLQEIWRLNPDAHANFETMGAWSILLLVSVTIACFVAARGLSVRARWGWQVALGLLMTNLAGDVANAVLRHNVRTLIGVPIAGTMILFLWSDAVRSEFSDHSV